MIFLGGVRGEKAEASLLVLVFKGSKNDSSGTLKEAFGLPGGNVIPACISRVTHRGMRVIKGSLGVGEARQSPENR